MGNSTFAFDHYHDNGCRSYFYFCIFVFCLFYSCLTSRPLLHLFLFLFEDLLASVAFFVFFFYLLASVAFVLIFTSLASTLAVVTSGGSKWRPEAKANKNTNNGYSRPRPEEATGEGVAREGDIFVCCWLFCLSSGYCKVKSLRQPY